MCVYKILHNIVKDLFGWLKIKNSIIIILLRENTQSKNRLSSELERQTHDYLKFQVSVDNPLVYEFSVPAPKHNVINFKIMIIV